MDKRKLLRLDDQSFWFKYGSTMAGVVIVIFTSIEIYALMKKRSKGNFRFHYQKTSLLLLLNLTVSDFFVGLTILVVKILFYWLKYHVIALTKPLMIVYGFLIFFFFRFSLLTSVLNMMAMTVDRYMVIRDPIKSDTGWYRWHGGLINVFIWVISISFVSLHYYLYVFKFSQSQGLRYEETIFSAVILPAAVAFCWIYIGITRSIKKKGRQILRASKNKQYMGYVFQREKRATKFAATVVIFFLICWFPLAVVGIVKAAGCKISVFVGDLIFSLAIYNSVGNPVIYFMFTKKISAKVRNIFKICR